jgi:peroxiredoxin Q/BCP
MIAPSLLRRVVLALSLQGGVCQCGSAGGASAERAAAPAAASQDLKAGDFAPDFSARDQSGAPLALAALRGKHVVLYFYPKDETPGCTAEAQAFRDAHEQLTKLGAVVIGVSADSDESHRAFAKSHGLPFRLISDADERLAGKYGVPVRLGFTKRQTFVLAPDGRIRRVYREVEVAGHVAEVLRDVRAAP